MHKSAGLRNAIVAIGALDLTHHSTSYLAIAIAYYKQAVSSLRLKLSTAEKVDDAALWTSLLLALFELMLDTTGTKFMLHFTTGLPALLRARGSRRDFSMSNCRSLLHAVQMLEVMRGASFWSYTRPTLLEDPYWHQLMNDTDDPSTEAHSFAILYGLMRKFLMLNNSISGVVFTVTNMNLDDDQRQILQSTASEGLTLHYELQLWYIDHAQSDAEACTPISLLSKIYHHTLAINLPFIFNFPHFVEYREYVPSISATELSTLLDEICDLLNSALRKTNLAGILLLWPLRVAGARTSSAEQAGHVLEMLREIKRRGFAVAQSFEDILMKRWQEKSLVPSCG